MPRFSASDTISIFDASLLWFDKNPDEQLYWYGDYGWIVLLTRDHQVRDLALALLSAVAEGSMPAKTKSWLPHYIPDSWKSRLGSPDRLDPRRTEVTFGNLIKFAKKRGQRPPFLAPFMTEPAGRPKGRQKRRSRAFGPAPGSVDRFGDADRALFSKIERIMRDDHKTVHGAALELAFAGEIQGIGSSTPESRARRLAGLFREERRKTTTD